MTARKVMTFTCALVELPAVLQRVKRHLKGQCFKFYKYLFKKTINFYCNNDFFPLTKQLHNVNVFSLAEHNDVQVTSAVGVGQKDQNDKSI